MQKIINNKSIVFVLFVFYYCFKLWNILSIEKISKDTYVPSPNMLQVIVLTETTIQPTSLPLCPSQVLLT